MRYVSDIPNPQLKIGLYAWNGKYIVKIETQYYEQTYKVSEMDFMGNENDLKQILADSGFIEAVTRRFEAMHNDFQELLVKNDAL